MSRSRSERLFFCIALQKDRLLPQSATVPNARDGR